MRRLAPVMVGMAMVAIFGLPASAQTAAPNADDYAWAAACKDCHTKHYEAWDRTKHATAIRRLSGGDREGDCVKCHVTGPKTLLEKDVNANIQCEECHGPGKAHIVAAAAGSAKPGNIARTPSEKLCVECHSSKSPHFKFFSYPALAPLIHQVAK